MASAIAMDKPMAKRLFAEAGLRCPKGILLHRSDVLKGDSLPRPYVVKPANEGSSVGVQIITKSSNARRLTASNGRTEIACWRRNSSRAAS